MPSKSKSQQRLMGVAYAVKSGDMELNDVDAAYRDKVKSLVDGMTKKDLKKYAETKHDGLPELVGEAFIGPFVFNDKMSDEELRGMYNDALDGYANHQKGFEYPKSDYKKAYQEIEKILKKRGVAVDENAYGSVSLNPGMSIGGIGDVVLPTGTELGSGDVPAIADIDDDIEKERNKKGVITNLEMENLHLTFESFLNEATDLNDPVMIAFRAAKMKREEELAKPKRKPLYGKQRIKAEDELWRISMELKDLYSERGQLLIDMEQEAEPEGGPIADEYGDKLNRAEEEIQKLIAKRQSLELRLAESVVNEKKLGREEMMEWIEQYMDFVKTTEEFNGSKGGIWVSGENGDEYKGRVIYAYYSEDYKNRTFGVDNQWEKELNKRGWYSEWNDPGTSMIWPM